MRAPGIVRIRRGDVPEASRREWIGLGVLAIPCVLYSMDLTVLNLAVPSLIADLRPSSTQLLWIIDIYGFVLAGSLIPMGTLGDRIGRRRLLLLGAAAFGVSSAIAAFATSVAMLIAARAILGVAGATLAPSTLSLIRNMFQNPAQRRVAVGVWVASFSAGTAIGPLVGGALLEHFWWGSVFLVGVPLMLVLLVLGPVLLPEFRNPAPGRVDLISSALSLLGILGIIYGLKRVAAAGTTSAAALSIIAGASAAILFVRRQARLAHPLIDLRVFRRPAFTAALAIYALTSFVTLGVFVFTSQYLQLVLRLSPWQAGLCTVPFAGAFIVGSLFTAPVARRVRPAWVIASGLFLAAAGFTLLAQLRADSSLALFIAGEVVEALGLAPVFTLANDLIIGSAPPGRAGAAAALSETGSELGGALGIAVLGSIGAVAYRHELAQAGGADLVPAARDALGTALQIAQGLPWPANAALAGAARHAFSSSLRLMCGVAAIVAVGLSIAAALLLESGATKVATIEGAPLSSLE